LKSESLQMIPPEIHAEIMKRLAATEREHGVRILLAIESGSRAWGFASPNSDFDVRFIYARPSDDYLSLDLEDRRDVIEYPIVDDIDLNGWDLRKALRLFWKSNPGFVEWIQSPIKYIETGAFAEEARRLLPLVYSCERGIHHYRSSAKGNYREHLQGEMVRLKKYFYVLRPLLAVRWLERYGTAAPLEFARLLHLIEGEADLLAEIADMLEQKRGAPELGLSPPFLRANAFIETELARLDATIPERDDLQPVLPALNTLFLATVREKW
jgi:predicted nucleotidyltransferase